MCTLRHNIIFIYMHNLYNTWMFESNVQNWSIHTYDGWRPSIIYIHHQLLEKLEWWKKYMILGLGFRVLGFVCTTAQYIYVHNCITLKPFWKQLYKSSVLMYNIMLQKLLCLRVIIYDNGYCVIKKFVKNNPNLFWITWTIFFVKEKKTKAICRKENPKP